MSTEESTNSPSVPKKKVVGFVPQSDGTESADTAPLNDDGSHSSEPGSQTHMTTSEKPSVSSISQSPRKSHNNSLSPTVAGSNNPIPTSSSPNSFQTTMHASYEEKWLLDDGRGGRTSKRSAEERLGSPRESAQPSPNAKPSSKNKGKQKQQEQQQASSPKGISNENKPASSGPAAADASRFSPADADNHAGRKSNKELKAERRAIQNQQRAEKAARVASGQPVSAEKAARVTSQPPSAKKAVEATPPSSASAKPTKPILGGQDPQASSVAVSSTTSAPDAIDATALEKQQKKKQVPWLSHLDSPKRPSMAAAAVRDLHPAMYTLGLQVGEYKIAGSNARCVAMLSTFSKIIHDHRPPPDQAFSRHIQKHLDPHIAYLLSIRPMSLSMRECIRWLKKEMAEIVEEDPPLSDDEARHRLVERIEHFIRDRITVADALIVQNGLQKIQNGDVILTYARSSIVQALLLEVHKRGVEFHVIVVDSRPMFEGKHLLKRLVAAGIPCSYVLLSAAQSAMRQATKVLLGAHALLNNGAVYARVGTAMVAMMASDKRIPVMVCCETYKFVNRTQVDALVLNEMGNPDDLVETNKATQSAYNRGALSPSDPSAHAPLAGWRDQPNLKLLNLMYDVTPSEYITVVVTEVGLIPCTSAPVIWREYNEEFRKRPQTKQ